MNQVSLNSNKNLNFKTAQQMQMQQIPQMPVEQSMPNVPLPALYNIPEQRDNEEIKNKLKKMDMMGLIHPWFERPLTMLGIGATMAWGVDKFSSACAGPYETSLVGKAARFGDKIQNSKIIQSKPFQTIWGWGESGIKKLNHIFRNSDVVNAIKTTPSSPEWGFVKDELLTMEQRVTHDFSRIVNETIHPESINKDGAGYVKLFNLGVDKKETEFIQKFFNGIQATEEQASNAIQLKRMGLADDAIREIISKPESSSIVKTMHLEKMGIDEAFLEKLGKSPATKEDIAKVREACQKANKMRIGAGHQEWMGKFQPFARKISLSEVSNRLSSMSEPAVNGTVKTKTGKAFATLLQKFHRGFTFGGGKMNAIFFVTPFLLDSILAVKEADPERKIGTAAHGLVHSVSWVFTFPLALSIVHRFGGMQYAGMSKEAVEEYRSKLKAFNEKANPYKECGFFDKLLGRAERKAPEKTFQSYGEYKAARKTLEAELKALRKVEGQTLFTKLCKKLGRFLTFDLETISHYKGSSNVLAKTTGGFKNFLRNFGGVPLRVGVWAALTTGVLDGIINKALKGCFGRHYDKMQEEEFKEGKKNQKKFLKQDLKARLQEAQNEKVLGLNTIQKIDTPPAQTEDAYQAIIAEKMKKKMSAINEQSGEKLENTAPEQKTEPTANETTKDTPIAETKSETKAVPENTTKSAIEEKAPAELKPEISSETKEADKTEQKPEEAPVKTVEPEAPKKETITQSKENNATKNITSTTPVKARPIAAKPIKRDNYTYIPSSENVIKNDKKEEDINKYIPSQVGAKFTKTFDNSGLEDALKRADRAEQKALQVLAGNFDSY